MPVIPATREVQIGRVIVGGQSLLQNYVLGSLDPHSGPWGMGHDAKKSCGSLWGWTGKRVSISCFLLGS
jgi:hypothetical protein